MIEISSVSGTGDARVTQETPEMEVLCCRKKIINKLAQDKELNWSYSRHIAVHNAGSMLASLRRHSAVPVRVDRACQKVG